MLRHVAWMPILLCCGCSLLPEMSHQPTYHNPFPQLSKVAVAPFFNCSDEKTLDGRKVAMAYFNELQAVPGFEVVPVHVVEAAMREHRLDLRGPTEARKLAQILDVDAVVVGAVTDYTPYYPPRMALQVEWYAANQSFHPILPGYGLPWGTHEEDQIPGPLVFEAEFALAKAQLKTQTPPVEKLPLEIPPPQLNRPATGAEPPAAQAAPGNAPAKEWPGPANGANGAVNPVQHIEPIPGSPPGAAPPGLPPNWPDPRGFIPAPPVARPPTCWPSDEPVIRHTKTYNGNDGDFTEALSSYYYFRNDARFGGWQSYLQRSDDFIRFCCHMHIAETLTARGGAGETRVVWRWPIFR